MLRKTLAPALLALAVPCAGLAEMITLSSEAGVEAGAGEAADPVVRGRVLGAAGDLYAGFRAATIPQPDAVAAVDLMVGIRPRVWDADMDLRYTRGVETPCCGELALSLDRGLGPEGRLGARVYFDPASDSTGAEARASVAVVRGTRIDGAVAARDALDEPRLGVEVGVAHALAELCRVDLRYRDAALGPARAQMSLRMDF